MVKIVFEGSHIQVLSNIQSSDILAVTFNEMTVMADGKKFWGQEPLEKIGVSALGFMSKKPNWFPSAEMIEAAAKVADLLETHKTIVLYGFSQGAYAAIKYSAILKATNVLAFSPQYSIDPADVGQFDERFSKYFDKKLNKTMCIKASDIAGNVQIFCDPHAFGDLQNYKKIYAICPAVNLIPGNYMGHGTVRMVASTNKLKRLLEIRSDSSKLKSFVRENKKNTLAYLRTLSDIALKRNRVDLAKNLYTKCAKNGGSSEKLMFDWRQSLEKSGVFNEKNLEKIMTEPSETIKTKGSYFYFGNLNPGEKQLTIPNFIGLALYPNHDREIYCNLLERLPIADGVAAKVQAQDVLEHLPFESLPDVLDEVYRILMPDGIFRVSVPDYRSPLLKARSAYDCKGNVLGDVMMGAKIGYDHDNRAVGVQFTKDGNAHVWFPKYEKMLELIVNSEIRKCSSIKFHQCFFDDETWIVDKIPDDEMVVTRSVPHDMRADGKPISLVVDFIK